MTSSKRGGNRIGGGRPSEWQNTPTCTIRVPKILAEKLLEIAKEIDKGLGETLIIQPEDLKVVTHGKRDQLSLSSLRIYSHSKQKVVRVQDLIDVLQGYLTKK